MIPFLEALKRGWVAQILNKNKESSVTYLRRGGGGGGGADRQAERQEGRRTDRFSNIN